MGIMSEMALEQWERDSEEPAVSQEETKPKPPAAENTPSVSDEDSILAALKQVVSEEKAAEPAPAPQADAAPQADKPAPEKSESGPEKNEDQKRAEHEASEAKRKAEFDAKQAEKEAKLKAELDRVASLSDEDVKQSGASRLHTLTERITRRDMKTMVTERLQGKCEADPAFARLCMNPRKDMLKCFQYLNRHAREYIEDEMKARGEKVSGMYGEDVPDELCYQWAEDYFRDQDAQEDKEQEEKFVPKPYAGGSSKSKSKAKKNEKKAESKPKPKPEKPVDENQISFSGLEEAAA